MFLYKFMVPPPNNSSAEDHLVLLATSITLYLSPTQPNRRY